MGDPPTPRDRVHRPAVRHLRRSATSFVTWAPSRGGSNAPGTRHEDPAPSPRTRRSTWPVFLDRLLPAISPPPDTRWPHPVSAAFRRPGREIREKPPRLPTARGRFSGGRTDRGAEDPLDPPRRMRAGRPYSVANVLRRRAVGPKADVLLRNAPEYIDRIRREGIVWPCRSPPRKSSGPRCSRRRAGGCINYHPPCCPGTAAASPCFGALLEATASGASACTR
jgi:hypothetical protein